MNIEKQKKIISSEEWDSKLEEIKIPRSLMDSLVMDYLLTEGYKQAAENFQQESSILISPEENLEQRDLIRSAIINGEIDNIFIPSNICK